MDKPVIDDAIRKKYKSELSANVKKYLGKKHILVRNGIVADKTAREVRISAVATGNSGDLPLEYVLVGDKGKAYESLAATMAKASDIHQAMEFIGMKAGHPIRPDAFQLWSKGDEVNVSVRWKENGTDKTYGIREILKYPETNTAIENGWIFTGSFYVEQNGRKLYVADDTGDLISTFNSPWTVFDVSGGAGQKEVYGSISPSEKYTATHQQAIEFIIKPTLPAGQTRNADFVLNVVPPKGGVIKKGDDLRFSLTESASKKAVVEGGKLVDVLDKLAAVVKSGRLVYATLVYDQTIPVAAMAELVQILQRITDNGLLRIEPAEDLIFYQAFAPSDGWRDPERRPGQPLEFFLPKTDGDPIRFRFYDEDYLDNGEVKLSEIKKTFTTDDELRKILSIKDDWMTQAVLFYATPTTTISEVQRLYKLLGKTYPIAFVFVDK
jgi:hypothetical protein